MYIGLGIVLLILGAILALGVITIDIPGVSDDMLGWILILGGLLAIGLSFAMRGRRTAGYSLAVEVPGGAIALVPAVAALVTVELEAGRVLVDAVPGLLDPEGSEEPHNGPAGGRSGSSPADGARSPSLSRTTTSKRHRDDALVHDRANPAGAVLVVR